jgi:hypothetical protein
MKARYYFIKYYCEAPQGGCVTEIASRWAYDAQDALTQIEVEAKHTHQNDPYFKIISIEPHPLAIPEKIA